MSPLLRFFLIAIALFTGWYVIYELWLHPAGHVDKMIIGNLVLASGILLKTLGYNLISDQPFDENMRTIGIDGSHGVWVGDPCNGLTLMALFAGFVIAYPGLLKRKLWFIPLGLLSIHLLNVIRVTALAIIAYYNYEWLDFNHTYTFTLLVYFWVFMLWYLWANKFSAREELEQQ